MLTRASQSQPRKGVKTTKHVRFQEHRKIPACVMTTVSQAFVGHPFGQVAVVAPKTLVTWSNDEGLVVINGGLQSVVREDPLLCRSMLHKPALACFEGQIFLTTAVGFAIVETRTITHTNLSGHEPTGIAVGTSDRVCVSAADQDGAGVLFVVARGPTLTVELEYHTDDASGVAAFGRTAYVLDNDRKVAHVVCVEKGVCLAQIPVQDTGDEKAELVSIAANAQFLAVATKEAVTVRSLATQEVKFRKLVDGLTNVAFDGDTLVISTPGAILAINLGSV